ncbi:hypothetical protein DOY81_002991 [Sarcophaga bullata]|nr:hypothetical protein DOY81_002991 [Sarcophaga bullata]
MGAGGKGWVAIGTQPMAAARANGSQAATEAILCGGMFQYKRLTQKPKSQQRASKSMLTKSNSCPSKA